MARAARYLKSCIRPPITPRRLVSRPAAGALVFAAFPAGHGVHAFVARRPAAVSAGHGVHRSESRRVPRPSVLRALVVEASVPGRSRTAVPSTSSVSRILRIFVLLADEISGCAPAGSDPISPPWPVPLDMGSIGSRSRKSESRSRKAPARGPGLRSSASIGGRER
jgi:hypothetical protein